MFNSKTLIIIFEGLRNVGLLNLEMYRRIESKPFELIEQKQFLGDEAECDRRIQNDLFSVERKTRKGSAASQTPTQVRK